MIYSMTAFARVQHQGAKGSFICEIRSVNHRYLEIGLHLPEAIRALEMPIRDGIRQFLKRGKIECTIRYQPSSKLMGSSFSLNASLIEELCQANEQIAAKLKNPTAINPADILRFPGVIETKEIESDTMQAEVLTLLEVTLKDLVAARGREGEELKHLFLEKITSIQNELVKVRQRLPQIMINTQERLTKRFTEAKLDLDSGRLEQEMVLFVQKIDIAEEIERTETHIAEIRRILQQEDAVGRRLDFLLQELNREANTLGSKSVDSLTTHAAVQMKVLIEQIREQVQNVE